MKSAGSKLALKPNCNDLVQSSKSSCLNGTRWPKPCLSMKGWGSCNSRYTSKSFLSSVSVAVLSKQLNAKPIFITNIASGGHSDALYALNSNLIKHCSDKNYSCIDLAKKIKGKYEYWNDGLHSTRKGSKIISDLIFSELKPIINSTN